MAIEEAQIVINALSKKIADTGYPPKEMAGYNVMVNDGREVWIYFTPPANTYLEGFSQGAVPLVEVGGVMIRKKHGSAITSINDGELLAKIPAEDMYNYVSTPLVDQDVIQDERYYYRFFPYSTNGRFNTQANDQKGVVIAKEWESLIFGFDQDFTDLNTETQISYPNDVENSNYMSMFTNPSRGTPTVGGWSYFIQRVLKNNPYMVKANGAVDYALDPNNYNLKEDGTPSDAYNTEYQGGAFAWLDALYTREWYTTGTQMSLEEGNVRHVRYTATIPQGEEEGHIDYIPAVGTYVSGTTYYTDTTGQIEVDTSDFTPGVTDVSSYYVAFVTQWEKVSCSWFDNEGNNTSKGLLIPMGVGDHNNISNASIRIDAAQEPVHSDALFNYATSFISSQDNVECDIYGGGIDSYIRDLLYMMGKSTDICSSNGTFANNTFGTNVTNDSISDVYPGFYCDENGTYATRVFHSFVPLGVACWQDPHTVLYLADSVLSTFNAKNISNVKYKTFIRNNGVELSEISLPNINFEQNDTLKSIVYLSNIDNSNIGDKSLKNIAQNISSATGLKTSMKILSNFTNTTTFHIEMRHSQYTYSGNYSVSGNDFYASYTNAYSETTKCRVKNGYLVYTTNLKRSIPAVRRYNDGCIVNEIECIYIVNKQFRNMPVDDFIPYEITEEKVIENNSGWGSFSAQDYPLGLKPITEYNGNVNYAYCLIPKNDYTPY